MNPKKCARKQNVISFPTLNTLKIGALRNAKLMLAVCTQLLFLLLSQER